MANGFHSMKSVQRLLQNSHLFLVGLFVVNAQSLFGIARVVHHVIHSY
jgi:hypothetical protein